MGQVRWRAVGAVLFTIGVVAIVAPRVGEPDRQDSRAISAIRAIISAESAYASVNGGSYTTLACLTNRCTSPDPGAAPYLEPDLATDPDQDGYRIAFHPHPDLAPAEPGRPLVLTRFAVTAAPVHAGAPGTPGFCGDDRATIYVTNIGATPRVADGRCLDTSLTVGVVAGR